MDRRHAVFTPSLACVAALGVAAALARVCAAETLSFAYEDGRPVQIRLPGPPLCGQDGWQRQSGSSQTVVVSERRVHGGRQAVFRHVAGGVSSLRRPVGPQPVGEPLSVSAWFYCNPESLPGESGWVRTAFVQPLDADGNRVLEFGVDSSRGPLRPYAFVPLKGVPDKVLFAPGAKPLKAGWCRATAVLDQEGRRIVSVTAADSEGEPWTIVADPLPYGRDSTASSGQMRYVRLAMCDNSAVDDISVGSETIDFEPPAYEAGEVLVEGPVRIHERPLTEVRGVVFVYATFRMGGANPVARTQGHPQAVQIISLGENAGGTFVPAVRFGLADDGRAGDSRGRLTAWTHDGQFDQFGPYARPDTRHDFKLALDLGKRRMTVWVSGRGDDDWYLLADDLPMPEAVPAINHVRVEQHLGAQGIEDLVVQSEPLPEREAVRSHPLAKHERVVAPGRGFSFQSMRSVWRQPGQHVTIARSATRWLGFPDVVQTGPRTLVCTHNDGTGHGGGGGLFVTHSSDLGRTWGGTSRVYPSALNCPRLQKLNDATLLLLADIRNVGPRFDVVLLDSTDGGKTWANQRWCHAKEAGGNLTCVPSRVTELPDGSWLLVGSWYPGMKPYEGDKGERLEIYRSVDRGTTWDFHSFLQAYPDHRHSVSEATILVLPDGRLLLYARENRGDGFPGIKAYSSDQGKTWQVKELPMPIIGRTCAGFLDDGRVMLTFREGIGRSGLWAWVGDPLDDTPPQPFGVHFNDAESVGLKEGCLHIDNDGRRGQFTRYFLRPAGGPETSVEVNVEVKVVANNGLAASLSVPFAGKFHLFPDHVEVAHAPDLRADVMPGEFHTYRVVRQGDRMELFVDGRRVLDSDKTNRETIRQGWTPSRPSAYGFAFGNDTAAACAQPQTSTADVSPEVTGYSLWRHVEATLDDPVSGKHVLSWSAARDGFPDQYLLDHILQVEESVSGGDQGYSGWTQLEDGRIFVTAYTDDAAPKWRVSDGATVGGCWIRGTFVSLSDLPAVGDR